MSHPEYQQSRPRRYALIGAGSRALMFTRAIGSGHHGGLTRLVALVDPNQTRVDVHQKLLADLGAPVAAAYRPADLPALLDREQVDAVVVTSPDSTHDDYIVAALDAGRDVITEKPMTIDATRCRRVLDAMQRSGRDVRVAFNYRYNPVHERVRELISGGEIGEVGSVHFEWLLDVRHGADYFRRWHRDKAFSGGLMVHKASHHFDLINWWINAEPVEVYARGRLFFYGPQAGGRHGYARDYDRAQGSSAAVDDPFALHLEGNPEMRALYLDAEHEDGYHRDRNVFGPGITIEDEMAALVRYSTGATMTYHLTAYSPWEGYRVMFNGSKGRLELDVVESDYVSATSASGAALHGADAPPEDGHVRLTIHPFWRKPSSVSVQHDRAGHGGGDARMAAALLDPACPPDPLGRSATAIDGAQALLTGLAANESIATGRVVRVADLLDLSGWRV